MDELDDLLTELGNASVLFRLPQVTAIVDKAKAVYDGLRSDADAVLARVDALEKVVATIVPPPAPAQQPQGGAPTVADPSGAAA